MKLTNLIGWKIKQILRSRGYDIVRHKELPEWLQHHQVDIVLDIGANDGRYAREIREAGWQGQIASFEPQPAAFQRLKAAFGNDPQWTGHPIGLGSEDAVMSMHVHEMDVLSSFLNKLETLEGTKNIEVPVKRADHILNEVLKGHKRPFVKMDTQGFEMEIIKGFGERTKDVIGWQLEMCVEPLYQNQPRMEEIIARMASLGFSLWRVLPGFRDPATLQAFELDGIFFRTK